MQEPRDENFFDPHDEKLSEEQAKQAHIQRMQELDDLRWVLSNVKGMRVIWRILGWGGIFRLSYALKDSAQTAFNEGARSISLRLLLDVDEADPKAYSQMQNNVLAMKGNKKGAS